MNFFHKNTILFPATAAMSFLLVSCGESKVAQCNKMIKVVNQAVAEGQNFAKNPRPKEGTKALNEVAAKVDGYSKDMKTLEIKDEKLQGFQTRFVSLYDTTSKGLRDTGAAIDKKDMNAARTALTSLKSVSATETQLVNEVNSYCSGKS